MLYKDRKKALTDGCSKWIAKREKATETASKSDKRSFEKLNRTRQMQTSPSKKTGNRDNPIDYSTSPLKAASVKGRERPALPVTQTVAKKGSAKGRKLSTGPSQIQTRSKSPEKINRTAQAANRLAKVPKKPPQPAIKKRINVPNGPLVVKERKMEQLKSSRLIIPPVSRLNTICRMAS